MDFEAMTMVISDYKMTEQENLYEVAGRLHGFIKCGDTVYVYRCGQTVTLGVVRKIMDRSGQLEEANNVPIVITIFMDSEPTTFSMLSNMEPETVQIVGKEIRNPYLYGLTLDYGIHEGDSSYLGRILFELVKSHCLVPVKITPGSKSAKQGVNILSLQNEDGKMMFPVFTNKESLSLWKEIYWGKSKIQNVRIDFQRIVDVITKGYQGVVINPFGPQPVTITTEAIMQLITSNEYKEEVVDKKAHIVTSVKCETNTKFSVECPHQNSEVKLIRDALVSCGRGRKDVKRIDLLLRKQTNGEMSYLCIVDCPEKVADEIFNLLDYMLVPFLDKIKIIDYVVFKNAPFLEEPLKEITPVYLKL